MLAALLAFAPLFARAQSALVEVSNHTNVYVEVVVFSKESPHWTPVGMLCMKPQQRWSKMLAKQPTFGYVRALVYDGKFCAGRVIYEHQIDFTSHPLVIQPASHGYFFGPVP